MDAVSHAFGVLMFVYFLFVPHLVEWLRERRERREFEAFLKDISRR